MTPALRSPIPCGLVWNTALPFDITDGLNLLSVGQVIREITIQPTAYRGLIILCELDRTDTGHPVSMHEFYGIQLAKRLRKLGLVVPILFLSLLPRAKVFGNKLDRGIINAIGHSFMQLPSTPNQWLERIDDLLRLNPIELYDIVQNYCSDAGTARMILHSLPGMFKTASNGQDERHALRGVLQQLYDLFLQDSKGALIDFDLRFATITAANIRNAVRFVESRGEELIEFHAQDTADSQPLAPVGHWKLLLLDDEIDQSSHLLQELTSRRVQCMTARTVDEAQSLLTQDHAAQGLVSVVVSDYRLETMEDGVTIHQTRQGYSFLYELSQGQLPRMDSAAKIPAAQPYFRLVALSALPRKFLMRSFSHYGMRVEIFSKKDYLQNEATIKLLCDRLIEIGNEQWESTSRLLRITAETWKHFDPFYRYHRNSATYSKYEAIIGNRATLYCNGILQDETPFQLNGYTSLNFDAEKAAPSNPKYFSLFLDKMVCRRVAIWYSVTHNTTDIVEIHKIIKGQNYTGQEKSTTAKNQINTHLALPIDQFPWNMTIEERNWLLHDMGVTDYIGTEAAEQALLHSMSRDLHAWLRQESIEETILSSGDFQNFHMGERFLFGGNFTILRAFLQQLFIEIKGQENLRHSLRKILIRISGEIEKNPDTRNTAKLLRYLQVLLRQLQYYKTVSAHETVCVNSEEVFYREIVAGACRKIPTGEVIAFQTNALLFYHDPSLSESKKRYVSVDNWVKGLLDYHREQTKALLEIGISFDENRY